MTFAVLALTLLVVCAVSSVIVAAIVVFLVLGLRGVKLPILAMDIKQLIDSHRRRSRKFRGI